VLGLLTGRDVETFLSFPNDWDRDLYGVSIERLNDRRMSFNIMSRDGTRHTTFEGEMPSHSSESPSAEEKALTLVHPLRLMIQRARFINVDSSLTAGRFARKRRTCKDGSWITAGGPCSRLNGSSALIQSSVSFGRQPPEPMNKKMPWLNGPCFRKTMDELRIE
jgi:hypothetical protein